MFGCFLGCLHTFLAGIVGEIDVVSFHDMHMVTWSLDVCPRSLNDTSSSIFDGRYVANWIAAVSEENKMKETRGFYRKMLLSAGIYKTAEEADLECKVPDWPRLPLSSEFVAPRARFLSLAIHIQCRNPVS